MISPPTRPLTLRGLAEALHDADPAALLVSPRLLRRVIRLDRRIPAFGFGVPHGDTYLIVRERLFDLVSHFELELDPAHKLPDAVLLVKRPDEEELQARPASEVLFEYWRLLFHIRVHLELQRRVSAGQLTEDGVLDRLRRIGSAEYAEIRGVLQRDEMLLPPRTDLSTYVEFAATFLELRYFAPELLPGHFPALRDADGICGVLGRDIDHRAIYDATRLAGAERPPVGMDQESIPADPLQPIEIDPLRPSPPAYWRLIARAERAGLLGNAVKAAILRYKASRVALPNHVDRMKSLAVGELKRLVGRLQRALNLEDEVARPWVGALIPVLQHADRGFRTAEARLLYDLQKVCVEHERGVFSIDLFSWCRSLGGIPLRRPLPLLRQALVAKHLQSAARKLTTSRLTGAARERLSQLIDRALAQSQVELRALVGPVITAALEGEGLQPRNIPERVAFRKIVEELLDRIVTQGFLSFGHIRDTLSQNNLKLPDLTRLRELVTGDLLLRIDSRLDRNLDGVYHHGPVYLRASHRLSALAFGTNFGRFLTRYVALPFGGAFLIVEGLSHIVHLFDSEPDRLESLEPSLEVLETTILTTDTRTVRPDIPGVAQVLLLGIFLLMLLENAAFRHSCLECLRWLGRIGRKLVYDLPVVTLRLPWVRRLLDSPLYTAAVGYLLKPLLITGCLLFPFALSLGEIGWPTALITFLAINLTVNSPVGRYADEWLADQLLRGLRGLHLHVFVAGFRLIMDSFHWLLQAIEQVLYTVDEWLLFRTGESRLVLAAKAVVGAIWAVINYVVRIYVTLLIEPQINPIKHFPVVTVSHKIMLPFSIHLTRLLAAPLMPLGGVLANTIAGTTVFLLPGVFGFLVWELKENWRLYAANRPRNLKPIHIGHHGETMLRLLRLGVHSGTVPRLFARLRAAHRGGSQGRWKAAHKQQDKLQHVELALRHFVERELVALLAESGRWQGGRLEVGRIRLASNQVSIELCRPDLVHEPLWLMIQERAGWLVASLPSRGWLDTLPGEEREAFTHALNGLYKSAGIDMVWERVVERLGPVLFWYDVIGDGLLLWRDSRYAYAILYKLRDTGATAALTVPLRSVIEPSEAALDDIMFSRLPIGWGEWVRLWPSRDEAIVQAVETLK